MTRDKISVLPKEHFMKSILATAMMVLALGSVAEAQDFGLTAGFSQSTADSKISGITTGGVFGFRLGGVVAVPLTETLKFRSGLIYAQRHITTSSGLVKNTVSMDYLDVPVLAQYNFNETFGIFGGLIAAFNTNHQGVQNSLTGQNIQNPTSLIPLLQVGINGTFQDQFGVEAYYERGVGDIYDGAKNYSVFGANFIYWL
jgi:hypothetical protein